MIFKLSELGEFKNGANYPKDSYGKGIKIINVKDLFKGHFIETDCLDELKDNVLSNPEQYRVLHGDLLFTRSSLVQSGTGMVAMVNKPSGLIVYCGFIIRFRPNQEITDSVYLTYLLRSNKYRSLFTNLAAQTTITNINQKTLGEIEVDLPSLPIQKTVSKILVSFDDKIESNDRINRVLEKMAQSIFNHWFVDFEFPDENGNPYRSSGGGMAESELGPIPEGWEIGNLTRVANYLNGLAMQKYRPCDGDEGLPVLKIKELRQGGFDENAERCRKDINEKYVVRAGDVVFSWSGSLMLDIWCGEDCGLNQHLFKVSSDIFNKWFFYFWTQHHLDQFIEIAAGKVTTMGHIQRKHLEEALVFIPSGNVYYLADEVISPIFELIINNRIENKRLATIRDSLVPKLVSGEIRVPAEEPDR